MFPISRTVSLPPSRSLRAQIVSSPIVEPVTKDDYVAYGRVKTADIDFVVVNDKLISARERVEKYVKRACVNQIWDVYRDVPPGSGSSSYWTWARFLGYMAEVPLTLPVAPCISVIGAYVTDDTGTEWTVDTTAYWVSRTRDPVRIALRNDFTWPESGNRSFETFRVRLSCGYLSPFTATASSANLSVPNHGQVAGNMVRVTNRDGVLPAPLEERTGYYVLAVVDSNTVTLATTLNGAAIVCTDTGNGVQFLGELPSMIRRAILLTAADDRFGAGAAERRRNGAGAQHLNAERHGDSGLPPEAEAMLQSMRILRIA